VDVNSEPVICKKKLSKTFLKQWHILYLLPDIRGLKINFSGKFTRNKEKFILLLKCLFVEYFYGKLYFETLQPSGI
jgi:hypothetical protein